MLSGSIPAIPTPFRADGIDEASLRDHVSWLIEQGSTVLVACGTTGEAHGLSDAERRQVLEICISEANGRVPVIAGCGTASTASTLTQVQRAADSGAAAVLVTPPCFVRPGSRGILAHFTALATGGGLPIVLYNVPTRTGVDMTPDLMGELVAAHPQVFIAVKDATGRIGRVVLQRESCGDAFLQLSGNDETALGFMSSGGHGCISVTANVAPRLCADFHEACLRKDFQRAEQLHALLLPLHRAMFCEPSPAPLKYALSRARAGYPADLRLPMVNINSASERLLDEALIAASDNVLTL